MNDKHEEISQILNELQNIHYPSGIQFQSKSIYYACDLIFLLIFHKASNFQHTASSL